MSRVTDRLLHPSITISFPSLFIALLAMLAIPIFLPERFVRVAVPFLFTLLALAALASVAQRRQTLIAGVLLAVPAITLNWQSVWLDRGFSLTGELLAVLFLVYVVAVLLHYVVGSRRVNTEILFGIACVYLLFALIWAMGYEIAHMLEPGAFKLPETDALAIDDPLRHAGRGFYTYFSFVTLSTLGYGDISPLSDSARALAMLEATLGQLFLVIVVARLVGLHTAQGMAFKSGQQSPETAALEPESPFNS